MHTVSKPKAAIQQEGKELDGGDKDESQTTAPNAVEAQSPEVELPRYPHSTHAAIPLPSTAVECPAVATLFQAPAPHNGTHVGVLHSRCWRSNLDNTGKSG